MKGSNWLFPGRRKKQTPLSCSGSLHRKYKYLYECKFRYRHSNLLGPKGKQKPNVLCDDKKPICIRDAWKSFVFSSYDKNWFGVIRIQHNQYRSKLYEEIILLACQTINTAKQVKIAKLYSPKGNLCYNFQFTAVISDGDITLNRAYITRAIWPYNTWKFVQVNAYGRREIGLSFPFMAPRRVGITL